MQSLVTPPEAVDRARVRRPRDFHGEQHRLLARIHRKFWTVTEDIPLGPITLAFTRIADPNLVLDQACDEEDRREKQTGVRLTNPPHLPYWAELWESSRALAMIVARGDLLRKPHDGHRAAYALDLGCGMGLAGTAAAAMGFRVTLVDLEPPALLFARLNTLPYDASVRRLNWQTDTLNQNFDLILGADIVYERSQWPHLNKFFLSHLAPGGAVILTEPHRPSGDLFIPWIESQGWTLEPSVENKTACRIRTLTLSR
jgi:predicted nicotinamide N-methyase